MKASLERLIPYSDSIWSFVDKSAECWNWTGNCHPRGYGRFHIWRKDKKHDQFMAHRVIRCLTYGSDIPDGLELDHLCRNTRCVNPSHLEPVTHAENMARGFFATKTHCKHGHQLSGDNLWLVRKPKTIERRCKTCFYLRLAAYRADGKVAAWNKKSRRTRKAKGPDYTPRYKRRTK